MGSGQESKVLPVVQPIVASNTEHGYLLSGVLTNPKAKDWLMGNYVNQIMYTLRYGPDMNFYPLVNHTQCPCIDYLRISRDLIMKKWEDVFAFILDMIDHDYYIMLYLDTYYIPCSDWYQNDWHFWHPTLLYGYDRTRKVCSVGDFYIHRRFGFKELSFDDLRKAFYSDAKRDMLFLNQRYFGSEDAVLYRNRTDFAYRFEPEALKIQCENYLNSTNLSHLCNLGDGYYFAEAVYGIETLHKLEEIIAGENLKKVNFKFFTVPAERTQLMLERMDYLGEKGYLETAGGIKDGFAEIDKMYKILLSLTLKYNMTKDRKILQKIKENIQNVYEKEEALFEYMISHIKLV